MEDTKLEIEAMERCYILTVLFCHFRQLGVEDY